MTYTSIASTRAALALLIALFGFNVYRAATCDITPEEAWNYDRYVEPRWQDALRQFDVNNHVLNTIASRVSTSALGRKEIALRLPSLLAGLLFYWAVWGVCRRIAGSGWGFAAAVGMMVLNPAVADAAGESRGYGMALAAWLWALDRLLIYLEKLDRQKVNQAAMLLGLSIAACLPFLVPVLGLALTAMLLARRGMGRDLWLPMLMVLFVLLAIPMNRVQLSDLAVGATSLRQTLGELTAASVGADGPQLLWAGRIAAALLMAAGGIVAVRRGKSDTVLGLVAGSAWIGLLILLAAHGKIHSMFPQRGGIYFVVVLTLMGISLVRRWPTVLVVAGAIGCVIYAAQLRPGAFIDGREFIGSREMAKVLRADAAHRIVRVAASVELEPIVNYYRNRYRQGNWGRVERKAPEPGFDYYVLTKADGGLVERYGLRVIHRYPGIVLAAR